jgi:hypothetical protein
MTQKTKDNLGTAGKILTVFIAACAVIGIAWANLAEPRIDKKIDQSWTRTEPRVSTLIEGRVLYVELLIREMATCEQKRKADEEYKRIKMQQK